MKVAFTKVFFQVEYEHLRTFPDVYEDLRKAKKKKKKKNEEEEEER